jgi:hypothetical protein
VRDDYDLPSQRLRSAIFWVLFLTWPGLRVVDHLWHPAWMDDVSDTAALMTALAFLLGKMLYQNTQKELGWRLRRVESRVMGAESLAPFFNNGRITSPVKPVLQAVRDDSRGARPRWRPGAR